MLQLEFIKFNWAREQIVTFIDFLFLLFYSYMIFFL